uniref:Protein kinase domain-containing protein n=1 Tax=Arcella intermedia TaxID=1963864 RepID=A0A6B2L552_9EUKA
MRRSYAETPQGRRGQWRGSEGVERRQHKKESSVLYKNDETSVSKAEEKESTETTETDTQTTEKHETQEELNSAKKRKTGTGVLLPKIPPPNRNLKAETQEFILQQLSSQWVIQHSDLTFGPVLGQGLTSVVHKGSFKEQEVAIKVLKLEEQQQDLKDFKEELFIMSQLKAHEIVHFYGVVLEPKWMIVMEFCPNGSLYHYIIKPNSEVTWERILKWCIELARGINSLHNCKPPLVHRDLKTLNLLLDRDFNIKICDFGLSRYTQGKQCDDATLVKLRGTYAYTAPELNSSKQYTAKSDIYSCGVIMWELVNRLIKGKHSKPYAEFPDLKYDFQVFIQASKNNRRPTIPPECPNKVQELIERCWSKEPEERPSAADLCNILKNLKSSYKKKKKWYTPSNSPIKLK